MTGQEAFLIGLFGGLLAEFATVNRHRRDDKASWPSYLKSPTYWLFGIAWVFIGGALAWIYHGEPTVSLNRILALNIGATAPLIVHELTRITPKIEPGSVD